MRKSNGCILLFLNLTKILFYIEFTLDFNVFVEVSINFFLNDNKLLICFWNIDLTYLLMR